MYRGEKAVYKFLEAMLQEAEYCKKVKKEAINLTSMEEEEFEAVQNITFVKNTLLRRTS